MPSSSPKPPKSPNSIPPSPPCNHSPSATLEILILTVVLFSGIFLFSSYFAYILRSLSILLSNDNTPPLSCLFGFSALFIVSVFCCGPRSRRCDRPGCRGMKAAAEFDLKLESEECVRPGGGREVDELPWKGGSEGNADYECLRAELRRMAPVNGRAVLIFQARCGCPVAKLEGWGLKKGRRYKKALSNAAINGG